jgi:hypothetical protein
MVDSPIILNLALSQADRAKQAPDPSRVQVDDRSLAELLNLAIEHGKLIQFYDLTNAPDGDWSALFASDPGIALASQASLDPRRIEEEMQRIGRQLRLDDRPLVREAPWRDLVSLIRQLLTILRRRPLREGPLATVLHQVERPMALVDAATSLSRFLESTGLDLRLGTQPILLKDSELRRLENLLRDFLGVLLSELEVSRQEAEQELQAELSRQGHAPQVALYIAFARLFQSIQGRLNRFPASLLDFYLQQVLHQDSIADKSLRPDRLALTFRAKAGVPPVLVPRQTLFSAGEDGEGQPIHFASDQDLEVRTAQLVGLRAMRVQGRAVGDGRGETRAALDAVWLTDINLPLPYPAGGPIFPLFGTDGASTTPQGATTPAVVGFALASPLLWLEGGLRMVRLTLRLTPSSLQAVQDFQPQADPASVRERIRLALERSLRWHYTSAEALAPLEARARLLTPTESASEPEPLAIELLFTLLPSAPAWRTFAPWGSEPILLARVQGSDTNAGGFEGETALTVLSLLRVESLALAVEVRDLQPTALQSSAGSLDPSQPLPIFGPTPVCGAFFSASSAEIGAKPLQTIGLQIDWHGLPISRDGFRGHYSGYRLDADGRSHPAGELFANSGFRVRLDLDLAAPDATDGPTSADLPLFATGEPSNADSAPLAPSSNLTLPPLKGLRGARGVRLVLSAPPHAFGDSLYAINCLDASRRMAVQVQASAAAGAPPEGDPQNLSWPNPPWCPRAASVRLAYYCTATLSASAPKESQPLQLLHLIPLDDPTPVAWLAKGGVPLLPQLIADGRAQEGTLLLTLSEPVPQMTLLFGLTSTATVEPLNDLQTLEVEAWRDGAWESLRPEDIKDDTAGLRRTGILRLTLENDRTSARLRLRVRKLGPSLPNLVCLEPNAVWATWQEPGGRELLNRSRAAGTVTTSLEKLPGIEEIRQPLPSSGGVAPASTTMEKVRLAERLRHKERAIQPDDYAQLLLSAFPFLWQVAVLPARNANGESEGGCVTIIPIPGPDSPTVPDPTIPSCDATLGDRLLAELRTRVSPFVRLHVAAPPYQRIAVCATVVVKDETRLSTTLEQLQAELVRFLSPWPAPDLGERPKVYYDETAISQFIRNRPYIESIDTITIEPGEISPNSSCVYYTSALRHKLSTRPSGVGIHGTP